MSVTNPSPEFLYLTTIGWRSGSPHEIEIWYVPYAGRYYLIAEHGRGAHWVQNIAHRPAITFRVDGQSFRGTGRMIEREAEAPLAVEVSALMDAKYEWSSGLIVELSPEANQTDREV